MPVNDPQPRFSNPSFRDLKGTFLTEALRGFLFSGKLRVELLQGLLVSLWLDHPELEWFLALSEVWM